MYLIALCVYDITYQKKKKVANRMLLVDVLEPSVVATSSLASFLSALY
jgi:hypothetical protein